MCFWLLILQIKPSKSVSRKLIDGSLICGLVISMGVALFRGLVRYICQAIRVCPGHLCLWKVFFTNNSNILQFCSICSFKNPETLYTGLWTTFMFSSTSFKKSAKDSSWWRTIVSFCQAVTGDVKHDHFQWYIKNVEPYLEDPVSYPKVQVSENSFKLRQLFHQLRDLPF